MSFASLILYSMLTSTLYYLLVKATITEFLWSRYPEWLDDFLACAACSGFWYGLLVGVMGFALDLSFLGLPGRAWYTIPLVGACSIVWTPLVSALMLKSLAVVERNGQ